MTQEVIVEADGGSRGNPGPAGYGAVVFTPDRAVLAERREFLGIATNNVAEYRGLIAGLAAAAELGARQVDVRMDSKLVVEQMSGRWQVKHPDMIPLAAEAKRLVAHFDRVSFRWIPRAQNSHADKLANEAMDAAAEGVRDNSTSSSRPGEGESSPSSRPWQREVTPSSRRAFGRDPGEDQRTPRPEPAPEQPPARVNEIPEFDDMSPRPKSITGAGSEPRPKARRDDSVGSSRTQSNSWTGATGVPTRLLLLRHGQTEMTVARRYSGRGDTALTALGLEQAGRAAKYIAGLGDIAAVLASPLERTRATAQAAADELRLPVTISDGLVETDFGVWEGLTFDEAAQRDPILHATWLGDTSVRPPEGESFDEVRIRVQAELKSLLTAHAGQTLLLVSHVTPIKTLLQLALNVGPSLLYRLHLDPASLSIAEFYPDGNASVRLVNDTSFLR